MPITVSTSSRSISGTPSTMAMPTPPDTPGRTRRLAPASRVKRGSRRIMSAPISTSPNENELPTKVFAAADPAQPAPLFLSFRDFAADDRLRVDRDRMAAAIGDRSGDARVGPDADAFAGEFEVAADCAV